jgi:hypothetical protein
LVFGQVGEKIKAKIGQETCILQVPGTCYRCCKKISNLKTGTNIPRMFWVSQRVIVVYWQVDNFSALSWREQVTFQWNDDDVHFVLDQHAYNWIFIVLADWNNSQLVEILLDLDTLSWFWANQTLFLLFNKQQIPIW